MLPISQSEQHCIVLLDEYTSLHAQETAPDEHTTAIQQSGDDVAEEESKISPGIAHIAGHVSSKSLPNAAAAGLRLAAKQCGGLLIFVMSAAVLSWRVLL